jgi:transmembrane protein TMEM260 (protein O-mannosyltransferase)
MGRSAQCREIWSERRLNILPRRRGDAEQAFLGLITEQLVSFDGAANRVVAQSKKKRAAFAFAPRLRASAANWFSPFLVFLSLFLVYVFTLAPGLTLWDSGEFLSAIHSLGIPHPPGTPLFVLIGNVWAKIFTPLIGFAYSINLLSAICSAMACALMANLFVRWTGDRLAAYAAAVCAGATSSLWLSATETEVYSSALLVGCLIFWIADHTDATRERKWLVLGAYVAGLGFALHLTALLTVPAAVYLAWSRKLVKNIPVLIIVFIAGASAVLFMLIRAKHDPSINQGNPSTMSALVDVILRRQYMPAPPWPRQAPVFIQIGNLFEYADWQIALGLAPDPAPTVARTGLSVIFGLLGIAGFIEHRRINRRSWYAMLILFLTATVGVLFYLNLKASPSYGGSFIPPTAKHEARERDYFFSLAFMVWGLWAGFGAVRLSRRVKRAPAWLPAATTFAAFVPVIFNWSAVSRRTEPAASEARRDGTRILASAPAHAVIFSHGDNETYPVWYLQEVENYRRDVTIVVVPLLPAAWYRAELARRQKLLTPDFVPAWRGAPEVVAALCEGAARDNRPIGDASFVTGDKISPTCRNR